MKVQNAFKAVHELSADVFELVPEARRIFMVQRGCVSLEYQNQGVATKLTYMLHAQAVQGDNDYEFAVFTTV